MNTVGAVVISASFSNIYATPRFRIFPGSAGYSSIKSASSAQRIGGSLLIKDLAVCILCMNVFKNETISGLFIINV